MVRSNTQLVAGGVFDTSMFLRSDFHPTSFIEVPREDLVKMANTPNRGFTTNDFIGNPLIGNYSGTTSIKYFFKGIGERDSIQFLIDNGIISV